LASFTQRIPNLYRTGPVIEVILTPSVEFIKVLNIPSSSIKSITVSAMIDTGASTTMISEGLAKSLGIEPVGTIKIHTPSSTNIICPQYNIQIIFPENVIYSSIVVTEAPLQGQHIQCLIGRDVLRDSVLIYNGHDNSFTLSF
jgi:hypothetical protein